MFCGCFCSVGSGIGGSDIGWVVMVVVVVMVRYWWPNDGDVSDVDCFLRWQLI